MNPSEQEHESSPDEVVYGQYPTDAYPYRAGLLGGLLGGLVMIVVGAVYGLVSGIGLWFPVNLIGATLVRSLQDASPAQISQFDAGALAAGLFIHLLMSAFLGLLFAVMLPALPGKPWIWALIVGPLLVAGSLTLLPFVNPVMDRYLDRTSFVLAHILYGLVMGLWITRTGKVPIAPPLRTVGRHV